MVGISYGDIYGKNPISMVGSWNIGTKEKEYPIAPLLPTHKGKIKKEKKGEKKKEKRKKTRPSKIKQK